MTSHLNGNAHQPDERDTRPRAYLERADTACSQSRPCRNRRTWQAIAQSARLLSASKTVVPCKSETIIAQMARSRTRRSPPPDRLPTRRRRERSAAKRHRKRLYQDSRRRDDFGGRQWIAAFLDVDVTVAPPVRHHPSATFGAWILAYLWWRSLSSTPTHLKRSGCGLRSAPES